MKKISYSLLLCFLVVVSVFSQPTLRVSASDFLETPQVDVTDINLTNQTFQSGDTVTGTFTVVNSSTFDVSDISYTISLTGNYQDGIPSDSYDTKTFGPISLKAQEVRSIPFNYKLPEAVSGEGLGIQIRNYLQSGVSMGWKDEMITVTGGGAFATITGAYVSIGNKQFGLQEGPIIKKDESGSVVVTLSNTASSTLSVIPTVTVFAQSALGKQLAAEKETALDIAAKGTKTGTYLLPTFNYVGGVYTGVITFLDNAGVARAPSVSFRYIVDGAIGAIQSITSTSSSSKTGDIIPLSINIAGSPFDIETGESLATGTAQLNISLFNEKDELVGKSNPMTVDLNGSVSETTNITALVEAVALRSEATLTYQGAVISSYKENLSGNYDEEKAKALIDASNQLPIMPIIVVGAIILIGVLVIVAVFKKKVQTNALVLVFAFGVLGLIFSGGHSLRASEQTSGSNVVAVVSAADKAAAAQAKKDAAAQAKADKAAAKAAKKPILATFVTGTDGKKVIAPTNKQVANGKKKDWKAIIDDIEKGLPLVDVDSSESINGKNGKPTSHDIAPQVYGKIIPSDDGTQFSVMLSVYSPACGNSPGDITAELLSVPGNSVPASQKTKTKRAGGHVFIVSQSDFSFPGPFDMPTAPGNYDVTGRVTNKVNLGQRAGVTEFHIRITRCHDIHSLSCSNYSRINSYIFKWGIRCRQYNY